MLKLTKLASGSYISNLENGAVISIELYKHYSCGPSKDEDGNKWVMSLNSSFDWDGDFTHKALTKKECIEYANRMLPEFEQLKES